jgi:cytochrome c553
MPIRIAVLAAFLAAVAPGVPIALAAPTAQQRQEISSIGGLVTKAANLYKDDKFKESGEAIKEALTRLDKLVEGADEQLISQLGTLHKRLAETHARLELEGIKLPELRPLESPDSPGGAGTVSFTKDVAAIIVSRCGGCHVRNMRGNLSMASYESLMKGSMAGKVVFPKDATGSVLIEKIEGKEMPPNGAGIPDDELAKLKTWITEGAKFDGTDPAANLSTFVSATPMPQPMAVQVKAATGKETISFSKDVAPVLAQNCTGCHGGNNPRNNFSLLTIESLLQGGDAGTPILPGKGADSLIVKKLRGTGPGQRMPVNLPPLADEVISKIEKWIDEGAAYDWSDPKLSLGQVAALAKATSATHEELTADRAKLAEENWRLGLPGIAADRHETPDFLILGNLGPNTLKQVGARAEALGPKIASIFKAPAGQPLVKGRMTIFAFKDRYDYGEFGKMVERRDLPSAWRGHFRFTVVDAYGALMPPKSDDYSIDVLLAEQIAGCYVAALGKSGTPPWFSLGAGRVAASRIDGGDGRVLEWDSAVTDVVSRMQSPDAFMTGKMDTDGAGVAAYSYVKFLMTDSRKFGTLLSRLRQREEFAPAFAQTYGASPNQLCAAWIRNPPARSGGRRGGKK